VEAVIDEMVAHGTVERTSTSVRIAGHHVSLDADDADVQQLLSSIGGEHEAAPPTIAELERAGVSREVIDAAAAAGLAIRVAKDFVFTPELVARAEALVRAAHGGITVSAFREGLGTSRKYALPLLEHLDRTGVSRRDGDLRFPR
jgi:selenocysteine-specific elongation factor